MNRVTFACVVALAACGHKDRKPPPAPVKEAMFSAREIATLEAAVARRRDVAKAMTCPTPVLHGTAIPGNADADILAFATLRFDKDSGEALATAVHAIAAHDDGCSPFQLGRAPIPGDQMPLVKAAEIIGEHAEQAHDLWLIADALRAYQDIGRGNVSMVTTTFVASAYMALTRHALAMLARSKPKDVKDLVVAFDALLASEPRFAGTVRGELAAMAEKLDAFEPTEESIAPSDKHAFALANLERLDSLLLTACPDAASFAACLTGLSKLREELKGLPTTGPRTKTTVLDAMTQRTLPQHDEAITARARATSALIAVRVALEVQATSKCAPPALPGVVPVLGEPLIAHIEDGALRLEPPAFAAKDGVQWLVQCGARARSSGPKNHQ